jgi:hypothetical protein
MSRSRDPHWCQHGNRFQYTKALGTSVGEDGRLKKAAVPISPASPEQRAKVRGALSIISAEGPCHPAHILDRRYGGCDSADCVIPLTPREHRDYEENRLDILGALIAGGFWVELGHVITEHEVGPLRLVELTTGEEHHPQRVLDLKQARIVELEAAVRP